VLTATTLACGRIEDPVKPKDEAIELLNARRYPEAVAMLKDLVARDPADHHLRILLASAQSGSVGFDVVAAFTAFEPLLKPRPRGASLTTDLGTAAPAEPAVEPETEVREAFEKAVVKLVNSAENSADVMTKIPHVERSRRQPLVDAALALGLVPEASVYHRPARAYSAVLYALQSLSFLRDSFPGLPVGSYSGRDLLCHLDVRLLVENVGASASYLEAAVADVAAIEGKDEKLESRILRLKERLAAVRDFLRKHKNRLNVSDLTIKAAESAYCD